MKLHPISCLGRALGVAAWTIASATAQAHDLTVEVLGARSDKGSVAGALYGSEASWLKDALQGERQAAADRTLLVYRNLQPGRYALSLFHDENGNGRLDKKLLMPSEGYGFSRDAPVRFGPPRFAAAAFAVDGGEQRQTIRMRYMF